MAKIAVESERVPVRRVLARGDGWSVSDVICCAGPHDRPFEEQHSEVCVALVTEGTFQYRSSGGRELMTPGSLLLGNAGQPFECSHEHGVGDRCLSFAYDPPYFDELIAEAGIRSRGARFLPIRVPPARKLSPLAARVCAGREQSTFKEWEEISLELPALALELAGGGTASLGSVPSAEARVTRVLRVIESHPNLDHGLASLAGHAKLSRYHFLRIFRQLTGLTPHQYVLRIRLRRAATLLALGSAQVVDIALDSGFGDISNFNRMFRAEFGVSPRQFRAGRRS